MKIYTKGGDKGKTSLVGGERISKSDFRIDLYGEVDELNSYIGSLRVLSEEKILEDVQHYLFNLGSLLACSHDKWSEYKLPTVKEEIVINLEKEIDRLGESLAELKNFILPGGSEASARAHICRTVTRRVERKLVKLGEVDEESIPNFALQFFKSLE